MNPLHFTRSVRSLNRLRLIAQVLTQHGFGYVVARMNLSRYIPGWMVGKRHVKRELEVGAATIGRQLRRVCEDLGPTFIKLAQMLTTRPDILPEEIITELSKLQDDVPPFDTPMAMQIIEEQLGRPLEKCFSSIDEQPIASGSIGQVYRARSLSGTDLVIKVRRPGIEQNVELDMQLLHWLAESIEHLLPEVQIYRPVMIVTEFEEVLRRELDLINEASATARLHEAFKEDAGIRIPQVHWECCAGKVLTMEALPGVNVGRYLSGQEDTTVDLPQVGKRLAEAYLKQIFDVGVFHADPHPGNILIDPPATVGLIDFGQVGTLTDELMTQFVVLIYAAINRETGLVVTTLGEMGALGPDTDPRQLQRSLRFLIDKYDGLPLRSIDLGRLFSEFTHVIRDCDVVMPREVPMLVKALSMATNTAQRLDPDLNVLELLKPKLKQALMQRVSPQRLARAATVSSFQLWGMLRRTPGLMSEALRRLAAGTWELNLKHANLDRLAHEMDRSSNRLSLALVIAAIIVGSSVVVSANTELTFAGMPVQVLGLIGYVVAGVMGMGLAWAIFRSGRLH